MFGLNDPNDMDEYQSAQMEFFQHAFGNVVKKDSKEKKSQKTAGKNASNRYQEGDVLAICEPWVYALDEYKLATACSRCLMDKSAILPKQLKRCGGCRYLYYCSEACQVADWKDVHRMECQAFKMNEFTERRKSVDSKLLTLFIKVICKLQVFAEKEAGNRSVSAHTFYSMSVCEELVSRDPVANKAFLDWLPFITAADMTKRICSDAVSFCSIYGRIIANVAPLHRSACTERQTVRKECETGLALYLSYSAYEKSCTPNAVGILSGGKQMVIKAVRNIGHIEQITIGHSIQLFAVRKNRQELLARNYIECRCEACTRPSAERLKCKDPCKEIVVLNVCTPHKCGACGHITSKDNMLQAERVMRWLWFHFLARSPEESVRAAESSDFMEMKTAYDKGMLLLHPTHFLLGLTHQQQALRQEVAGNFGRSIRFWMKMLPSAEFRLGKYDGVVMMALTKIFIYYLNNGKRDEGLQYLKSVWERMKIISGSLSMDFLAVDKLWTEMQNPKANLAAYMGNISG